MQSATALEWCSWEAPCCRGELVGFVRSASSCRVATCVRCLQESSSWITRKFVISNRFDRCVITKEYLFVMVKKRTKQRDYFLAEYHPSSPSFCNFKFKIFNFVSNMQMRIGYFCHYVDIRMVQLNFRIRNQKFWFEHWNKYAFIEAFWAFRSLSVAMLPLLRILRPGVLGGSVLLLFGGLGGFDCPKFFELSSRPIMQLQLQMLSQNEASFAFLGFFS